MTGGDEAKLQVFTGTAEDLRNLRHRYSVSRERLWINYPPFIEKLDYYDWLATAPPRRRERVTSIIGPPNSGKTALIEEYLRLHPKSFENGNWRIPAIHLTMTHYRRVEDVSAALLRALKLPETDDGLEHRSTQKHTDRMERFYRMAPKLGLQLVFLDEFHDCANVIGRGKGAPFLQMIKSMLLNKIRVIPVGTYELKRLLDSDDQIKSRFGLDIQAMPAVTDCQVIRVCMEQISGLSSDRITDAAVGLVHRASLGYIGRALDLIENTLVKHGSLQVKLLQKELNSIDVQ